MNTLAATKTSTGFFERVVLNALSKMTLGKLELTLLNGEVLVFGNGEDKITANIQVNQPDFFKSIALYGDIGLQILSIDVNSKSELNLRLTP